MTHREKCEQLKSVRKKIADQLGIDLHQRECTYKGECSGTCPRCAQEERTLNKALLTGTVALSTIALTACGNGNMNAGSYEARVNRIDRIEENQNKCEKGVDYEYDGSDYVVGDIEEYQTEGDVAYIEEGDVEYYGGDDIEYGGDDDVEILMGEEEYYPEYTFTEYQAETACREYTNAPIVEFDSYKNDDSRFPVFHCYEEVDDGDGTSHTATIDWLTVDLDSLMAVSDIDNSEIDLSEYID